MTAKLKKVRWMAGGRGFQREVCTLLTCGCPVLRNRHDSANSVSLFYIVKGKHRPGRDIYPHDAWGEGMVEVERSGTQWRVNNYSVYY